MALIEPRLLEGLQSQQQHLQTPVSKTILSLDDQMKDVLSRPDISSHDKVKLYNQVLQRYINYNDQQQATAQAPVRVTMIGSTPSSSTRTSPAPEDASSSPSSSIIEQEVLDSVPTRMKKKAQLLMNRIKASPELAWTDVGEMVYKGQILPHTNISDLVNDALRRRKHFEPRGWEVFARAMKETNVPQDLIGHRERWQWMQRQHQDNTPSTTPSPVSPTPISQSRRKKKRIVSTRVPRWTTY